MRQTTGRYQHRLLAGIPQMGEAGAIIDLDQPRRCTDPDTDRPKKKPHMREHAGLLYLAPRPGLEPGTYGLTVRRSTD